MTDESPGTSQICLHCGYVRVSDAEGARTDACPRCGLAYHQLDTGRLCRKCGYVRQATDPGPEFSCPSCGAVYAKVEKDGFWRDG